MNLVTFNKLTLQQKENLYNFIYRIDKNFNKNYEEMIQFFESEVFDYGNQMLIVLMNSNIIMCLGVITREIEFCDIAYITELYIHCNDLYLYKNILKNTLEDVVRFSISKGAKKVSLGIRNEMAYLTECIIEAGFKKSYHAIIMAYECKSTKSNSYLEDELILKSLSSENMSDFVMLHNKAFCGEYNAATINEEDAKIYLQNYKENEDLIGIISNENRNIGIYMLSKIDNIGWIDNIAILEEFRGKGLGRELLSKCIEFLKGNNVDKIRLLVISSNCKAYNLYKSLGFNDEEIFSEWFEN